VPGSVASFRAARDRDVPEAIDESQTITKPIIGVAMIRIQYI
jgi:hypothetical protein